MGSGYGSFAGVLAPMPAPIPSSPRSRRPRGSLADASGPLLGRFSGSEWLLGCGLAILALSSVGFFTVSTLIAARDPGYFERRLLAEIPPKLDPITTGTVAGEAPVAGDPLPVPNVVRARIPEPADYGIVMIFDGEAMLATATELQRVKVGSTAPGLGKIIAIEAGDNGGGVVKTEKATLRSVAQ